MKKIKPQECEIVVDEFFNLLVKEKILLIMKC